MKSAWLPWIVIAAVYAVPYLLLFLFGGLWLWERGYLWLYLGGLVALTAAAWGMIHYLRTSRSAAADAWQFPTPYGRSPLDDRAWETVEGIASQVEQGEIPLDSPEAAKALLLRLLEDVAGVYHAGSRQAMLQVPLPDVLKLVERVTADLRTVVSEKIPGSHVLTIGDWLRIRDWWRVSQWAWFLYRLASIPLSPGSSLFRELRTFLLQRATKASLEETVRRLKGYAVRRAGYYAIELYTGRITPDDKELDRFVSPAGRKTLDQAESLRKAHAAACREPFRVLVASQKKAGKSSLVNALLGSHQAPVDAVPCTEGTFAYRLPKHGEPPAGGMASGNGTAGSSAVETAADVFLLDTPGYGDDAPEADFQRLLPEIRESDVIIIVCSARNAGRKADREFLSLIRRHFAQNPKEIPPSILVAGTCIDQLRPMPEWNPPYDLDHPAGAKATAMAAFLRTLADDLEVPRDRICGICAAADREWNVRSGLRSLVEQAIREADPRRRRRHLYGYRRTTGRSRILRQVAALPSDLFRLLRK
ncbi:MAG: hypothetical protein GYA33_07010 [Thermogutta sp.]|nr:hypothetical protein [Thermogutta sp.]